MASTKHPHQMPFTEYVEWARSKIVAPDGRISRAGVAEVRRDLVSRVGYLSRTPDEKAVQQAIKLLDPSVDLTTEALAQLESVVTSTSETITQEGNEMADTTKAPNVNIERHQRNDSHREVRPSGPPRIAAKGYAGTDAATGYSGTALPRVGICTQRAGAP